AELEVIVERDDAVPGAFNILAGECVAEAHSLARGDLLIVEQQLANRYIVLALAFGHLDLIGPDLNVVVLSDGYDVAGIDLAIAVAINVAASIVPVVFHCLLEILAYGSKVIDAHH